MSALEKGKKVNRKKSSTIDPIYKKLMRSVERSIGSTEFYDFFMDALTRADNEFQFSNRRVEKIIDLRWVNAIEATLESMQHIISSPRNIIKEEELIVNVAHAKKGGSDVVRHLAQHGSLVEDFNEESGEVRPSRLMQKFREDSEELYENRLAFTTIEMAYRFTEIRYNALFAALGDEFGAKLKVNTELETETELIHFDTYMHIKEKESTLEKDARNGDVLARIDRLHRLLTTFINSSYGQTMSKLNRVKGNVVKTNVLKKNPYYRKLTDLYDFLRHYDDVGYAINITEQNPVLDETMVQNVFHNTLFQYIVLKGYLESEEDRMLPSASKQKKRKLKPKVIKEIIEELTDDYDIPDLEIRKVLIEELTREQLALEEEAEKQRLLEEQVQRKMEEEDYRELLMEQDKERIRQEYEAEQERLRLEEEERKRKEKVEELKLLRDDERRKTLYTKELDYFSSRLHQHLDERESLLEQPEEIEPIQDYINAAKVIEDEEIKERLEEELRLQKIEDERKYPVYRRELNNFFNSYKENLASRGKIAIEEEVEPIQDYLFVAKTIEDKEIAERLLQARLDFEHQQEMLRLRKEFEKEEELARVKEELRKHDDDNTRIVPYLIEIRNFNALLSLHRHERKEYLDHQNELNDMHLHHHEIQEKHRWGWRGFFHENHQ